MKMKIFIVTASILLFTFLSCSTQNVTEHNPYGGYNYESRNMSGDLVSEGSLYISRENSNKIKGNWSLTIHTDCLKCGDRSGFLIGSIRNDSIFINLDPSDVKLSTVIVGKFDGENFAGDWEWTSHTGFFANGTFEAVRQ